MRGRQVKVECEKPGQGVLAAGHSAVKDSVQGGGSILGAGPPLERWEWSWAATLRRQFTLISTFRE